MYTASLLAASCAVRGVVYDFVQSFCWLASQSGLLASLVSMENCITLQSGAATRTEGFVVCLLKVLLTCLRRISAAVQPNSKQNYQKTFYKIFGTSCRPRLYISYILKSTLYGGYGSSQQTNHALQCKGHYYCAARAFYWPWKKQATRNDGHNSFGNWSVMPLKSSWVCKVHDNNLMFLPAAQPTGL